jgi:hypothetical protein
MSVSARASSVTLVTSVSTAIDQPRILALFANDVGERLRRQEVAWLSVGHPSGG